MAIQQALNVQRNALGDGSSLQVTIDFVDDIKASNIDGTPAAITAASANSGTLASASISGSKVTFVFSTAPGNVVFTLSVTILFPGN